jgi:Sec7-like guanine-nucleotide exchange factor
MDFKTYEIDHALRYFLSKFRLPGEAQKIDRIMEVFAAKFCSDNPSVFNNQGNALINVYLTVVRCCLPISLFNHYA